MTIRRAALLCAVLSACAPAVQMPSNLQSGLRVLETHDAGTGTTKWQVETRYAADGPELSAGIRVFAVDVMALQVGAGDREAEYPTGFLLRLHAEGTEWRFLRNRDVSVLLNGTDRIELGAAEYEGGFYLNRELAWNLYREVLVAPILRDELKRISGAANVVVTAGDLVFRVHTATLEAVRRLLATVPSEVR